MAQNDGFALKTGAVSDVSRSVFQLTLTAQANVTRRFFVKWRDQHTHEQLEIAKMIKLHLHASRFHSVILSHDVLTAWREITMHSCRSLKFRLDKFRSRHLLFVYYSTYLYILSCATRKRRSFKAWVTKVEMYLSN